MNFDEAFEHCICLIAWAYFRYDEQRYHGWWVTNFCRPIAEAEVEITVVERKSE